MLPLSLTHHPPWYYQVGDQILKVCGMPVGQSTHREVVAVIQSRSRVQLKVRSGGLIPVRNRRSEPLSWRVVTPSERGNSGVTELVRREVEVNSNKPKVRSVEEADQCTEQRLQINLQGQQGLGCSICKVSFIIEQLAPLPVDTVPCGTHKQWAGAEVHACALQIQIQTVQRVQESPNLAVKSYLTYPDPHCRPTNVM